MPSERTRGGPMVVFRGGGAGARLAHDAGGPLELLRLAARPIGEPVARYGPFVMCTREEILQAFHDYQEGRLGEIVPEGS